MKKHEGEVRQYSGTLIEDLLRSTDRVIAEAQRCLDQRKEKHADDSRAADSR